MSLKDHVNFVFTKESYQEIYGVPKNFKINKKDTIFIIWKNLVSKRFSHLA